MEYTANNKTKFGNSLVKRIPVLMVGLALLVSGLAVYRSTQTNTSESEVHVVTIPEIKTVTALGRLEPSGEIIQISVSSAAEGNRIDELLVEEGDEIEKGQVIAILDSRDRALASLNQSQEQVRLAQAHLDLVKAGAKAGEVEAQRAIIERLETELKGAIATDNAKISRLQAQLETESQEKQATVDRFQAEVNNAQVEFQRYQQLAEDGVISNSELDSKELTLATNQQSYQEAQAIYNRIVDTLQEEIKEAQALAIQRKESLKKQIVEAQAKLDEITEVRPVDVAVAEAEVRQAKATVRMKQAELNHAYIKSPQAGRVIKTMIRPGEIVNSDEGIARIGQTKEMYAVAEVYQSDVNKVKIGQSVTVTSSASTGKLTGTVEKIGLEIERQNVVNTDPTSNIDARVVEVKVKLDKPSSQKVARLTNLQVNVRIEL